MIIIGAMKFLSSTMNNFTSSWLLGSLSNIFFWIGPGSVTKTSIWRLQESLAHHNLFAPDSPDLVESVPVMLGLMWRWLRLCAGGCWRRAVIWKCCGSGLAVAGPGLGSQVAAETPGDHWPVTGDQAPAPAAGIAQSPPWHTHTPTCHHTTVTPAASVTTQFLPQGFTFLLRHKMSSKGSYADQKSL